MQRLLEAPRPYTTSSIDLEKTQSEPILDENNGAIAKSPKEPEVVENSRISIPKHVELEPEKRGFWSRFFLPNG